MSTRPFSSPFADTKGQTNREERSGLLPLAKWAFSHCLWASGGGAEMMSTYLVITPFHKDVSPGGGKKKKKGHFSIMHVTYWKMRTNVTSQNDASFFPLMAKNENRTDFELPKPPAQSQAHMGIWVRCQSSPIHERTAPQFILRKPRTEPPEFVFFVSCSSEHLLGRGPYWFEKVNSLHPTSKIIRGSVVLIKRNTG